MRGKEASVVGVKSEGERKLQGNFLTCKYLYNII